MANKDPLIVFEESVSRARTRAINAGADIDGYAVYQHKNGKKYFIGPNGALRTGKNVSTSHSIGDPSHQGSFYAFVLKKGDELPSLAQLICPEELPS